MAPEIADVPRELPVERLAGPMECAQRVKPDALTDRYLLQQIAALRPADSFGTRRRSICNVLIAR